MVTGAGRAPPHQGDNHPPPLVEADVRLGAVLGRGASSVVYAGTLRRDGTPVAVKRVTLVGCGRGDARARQVANDLRALSAPSPSISSSATATTATTPAAPPGLVRLLGAYVEDGSGGSRVALVLERMDGGSLGDALGARAAAAARAARVGGPPPPPIPERALAALARDVSRGLAHLHTVQRTLHRDIKPANILLSKGRGGGGGGGSGGSGGSGAAAAAPASSGGRAALADFGIAAAVGAGEDGASLAACHTFTGTVTYMAPERLLAGGVGSRGGGGGGSGGCGGVPRPGGGAAGGPGGGGGGGGGSGGYSGPADVWALGLTLLEAAIGSYPYDASAGPLALMMQVVSDPAPTLQGATSSNSGGGTPPPPYSPLAASFLDACLAKDPASRPRARDLVRHPWVLGAGEAPLDVGALYPPPPPPPPPAAAGHPPATAPPPASPPGTAAAGAALVASAVSAVTSMYAARGLPSPAARAARLAPLYAPGAAFSSGGAAGDAATTTHQPARAVGARAVLAALGAASDGAASLGMPPLAPLSLDAAALPGGGGVAVLASGASPGPAPGPLGRAAGSGAGGVGSGQPARRPWSEAIYLACQAGQGLPAELRIVGQCFRWV